MENDMSEKKLPTGDTEPQIISKQEARNLLTQTPNPDLTIPAMDLRSAYLSKRAIIIDKSLDEGEKLHGLHCIRRGQSPSHFVYTSPDGNKTRHDLHITFDERHAENYWDAILCSCPTGRHRGDPCWHKGAVRAFLADNQHIRHANALLSLPLT